MAKKPVPDQYVVLPARGLRAQGATSSKAVQQFLLATAEPARGMQSVMVSEGKKVRVRVVDSIAPDGAKLIEASPETVLAIRSSQPSLRVLPVVYYTPAVAPRKEIGVRPQAARTAPRLTLKVVSRADRSPVGGAIVVAFTDYATGAGAQGTTNRNGDVTLALGGTDLVERLYVYPRNAFWTLRKRRFRMTAGAEVRLRPLDFDEPDALRHYYGEGADTDGVGVTVGVIDTGSGAHPDLVIAGGANTVPGEKPADHVDNGLGHGTHVAGIVAARGTRPTGVRGVAPGVSLRSYRVFARATGEASNFAIAKAVDIAVSDGCDLINMSLGSVASDPVIRAAVEDARDAGTLSIAASGNDGRAPVRYPAADESAVAVSALGRKRTFPTDSVEAEEVAPPPGTDRAEFIAAFSNVGPQIDVTGPGVGIISTYLDNGWAEISGTSMACPAVTGVTARLLPASGALALPRDAARCEAMIKTLLSAARSRGFGPELEGHGLPLP